MQFFLTPKNEKCTTKEPILKRLIKVEQAVGCRVVLIPTIFFVCSSRVAAVEGAEVVPNSILIDAIKLIVYFRSSNVINLHQ